jgi:hypothetical protein
VLAQLTRTTGQQLLNEAPAAWLGLGRRVHVADGTTVSLPDTPANQEAFPQARTQKPGLGFPIARLVVVFSLAVGTVLDTALGRYQGKESGETALLRQLHDRFEPGDVLLADGYYCSYVESALLQQRRVDVVVRQHQCRRTDLRGASAGGLGITRSSGSSPSDPPGWTSRRMPSCPTNCRYAKWQCV